MGKIIWPICATSLRIQWPITICLHYGLLSGVSMNDFWAFENGNWYFHSQTSGTGREWKKTIREREGKKKIHAQILGKGREWKKGIPEIRKYLAWVKVSAPNIFNHIVLLSCSSYWCWHINYQQQNDLTYKPVVISTWSGPDIQNMLWRRK